jgi:DNA-binding beta-propeller fold protein YncE
MLGAVGFVVMMGGAGAAAQAPLATIPTPTGNPQAFAVNPVTNKVYVVEGMGNALLEIDARTFATTEIPLQATNDIAHAEVKVNPNTNKIYVTNV